MATGLTWPISTPDEHTEMIVYYEYFPHDYINLPTVVAAFEAWQDIYEQVSPTLWPAFLAYTNDSNCDEDADDLPIPSRFLEAHMGEYESFDDYLYNNLAGDLIEEVNSCPEVVQRYFSWQSYIADAKYDYTVLPAPGSGPTSSSVTSITSPQSPAAVTAAGQYSSGCLHFLLYLDPFISVPSRVRVPSDLSRAIASAEVRRR